MPTPNEVHNEMAGKIIAAIVKPMRAAGGDDADIIVLLETVVAGVLLLVAEEDQYDAVCDLLGEQFKARLRELQAKARQLNETVSLS
jgi:hypothetical protein